MEYETSAYDRETLCPSPNFTIKSSISTSSTLNSFKNRLSTIFSTSPTKDKKQRMSILTSRSGTSSRRLRKHVTRSAPNQSLPVSTKKNKSLMDRISAKKYMLLRPRKMRRFSTFHNKPSGLDFHCAGDETSSIMMLERVGSRKINRMILGAVQTRRRGDLTHLLKDCAPRISWIQPDIAGWDFSEIGITIAP